MYRENCSIARERTADVSVRSRVLATVVISFVLLGMVRYWHPRLRARTVTSIGAPTR